jgi:hypothetical protein
VIEEDAVGGELGRYTAVYLTDSHLSRAATVAVEQYVLAGGTLFVTATAGLLDEQNSTNTKMLDLLGIHPIGIFEGTRGINNTIWLGKQDIPFATKLDAVTLTTAADGPQKGSAAMPVIGIKSLFTIDPKAKASGATTVHGTFTSDGSPAVISRVVGSGKIVYTGFLPSLSYFADAYPKRPVDRLSADDSMTHFIPAANLTVAARDDVLVGLAGLGRNAAGGSAAATVARPVTSSEPLVEAGFIVANATGSAIVLSNWAGRPVANLTVTLHAAAHAVPFKTATLATGGRLLVRRGPTASAAVTFVLAEPFLVADCIILRP